MCIYTHRQKLLEKIITGKFQSTLSHIQKKKIPNTHSHTHRGKITVSEIPNHSNAHIHTHTTIKTYQISKKGKAD